MTPRFIRKLLNSWLSWKRSKTLRRAIPKLKEYDRQLHEARKAHRRGSARIIKAKRDAVCAALRGRTA